MCMKRAQPRAQPRARHLNWVAPECNYTPKDLGWLASKKRIKEESKIEQSYRIDLNNESPNFEQFTAESKPAHMYNQLTEKLLCHRPEKGEMTMMNDVWFDPNCRKLWCWLRWNLTHIRCWILFIASNISYSSNRFNYAWDCDKEKGFVLELQRGVFFYLLIIVN